MNKIAKIILILGLAVLLISNVYAKDAESFIDAILGHGQDFVNKKNNASTTTDTVGSALAGIIKDGDNINILRIIYDIGNLIIFVITMVLGLKYIFSGVNGKADIKSTLPNYVLGIVFFYCATGIWELSENFMLGMTTNDKGVLNYAKIEDNLIAVIDIIVNMCAIFGIILVGLKYMLSPADTRADIKKELIPVVIGIVFVYSAYRVITIIYDFGNAMLVR